MARTLDRVNSLRKCFRIESCHCPHSSTSSLQASQDNLLADQAMYCFHGLIASLLVSDYDLEWSGF